MVDDNKNQPKELFNKKNDSLRESYFGADKLFC